MILVGATLSLLFDGPTSQLRAVTAEGSAMRHDVHVSRIARSAYP